MTYLIPPTKDQYQDILKEIGTDEQTIQRDVKYLIDWLDQTEYLPSVKDEEFLTAVLIRCKNSMEKAKGFLDYYYSRRTLGSDMFTCRDPCHSELRRSFELFSVIPLPKLTPEGCRVLIYISPKESNIPKMSYILSSWQMMLEVLLKSDMNRGLILLTDASAFSIAQSTLFLADFKKILDLLKKTTRTRYKESYIINASTAFLTFFNATKQFLSGKLLGRVQLWSKKSEELAKVLPKDILPLEFGGHERSLGELKKAWYECIMEKRDWFKAEENVKADLTKRPKNDPLSEEFCSFGLSGTFRKINLD